MSEAYDPLPERSRAAVRVSQRAMTEADDPHAPNVRWQYDPKWGMQWKGEGAGIPQPFWTTDLSPFVATPERIALWYRLMGECTTT